MVAEGIFIEISLVIIIALGVSLIAKLLRQPLIIAYIVTGILISPSFLNVIKSGDELATFAQMGIAVLLFMVGLHLDMKVIKEVGIVSFITGIGQILFTFAIGITVAKAFGFPTVTAAYIAIALAFSSTIVIMKLLSDKGDTSTLYGKISIGFLLIQDLAAILILMLISSLNGSTDFSMFALRRVGVGVALVAGLLIASRFVVRPATKLIARSQELLLLFSIAWAFALASLFKYAGFSIEIGALLAGITLSASPYKYEIGSRMRPLRDFFLLVFFVLLGSQLSFTNAGGLVVPVAVFSALVLIGNPIITMFLMGRLGYTKRNGFLAGLTVSQISEFSFIIIALGVSVGHVHGEVLSLITLVGLITMAGSSYAILNNNALYQKLSKYLGVFEKRGLKMDEGKFYHDKQFDIVMFGYNRIGYSLEKSFRKIGKNFLIVDHNPEVILKLARAGVDCQYGDAEDVELLGELPLATAKVIISTIPDTRTSLLLIQKARRVNKEAIFIVVSHDIDETLELYKAGASYVITPHFLGGAHAAQMIEKYEFDAAKFEKEGKRDVEELVKRKKEGQRGELHERD